MSSPLFIPQDPTAAYEPNSSRAFWEYHNSQTPLAPGAQMDDIKQESSPSPPRQPPPPRRRNARPFSPLLSRAEHRRRRAANENAAAIARTAFEAASRQSAAANRAAQEAAVHTSIARNALEAAHGTTTFPPAAPEAFPPTIRGAPADLLVLARRHIDTLTEQLRRTENEACDREEHLATLLEHARELKERAIEDRKNGLVIIRDRDRKLLRLEERILNDEEIDADELLDLLRPLKLDEPVRRELFEEMRAGG